MAEKIISPGVFTRENDLSYISQGIGEIGAVIIGPFTKGPAFLPTVVNTQSEFENIFGTPDGTYYTGYAVQNYLRESGTVTIVRVGHLGGYSALTTDALAVSSSAGTKIIATWQVTSNSNSTDALGFRDTVLTSSVSSSGFYLTGSDMGFAGSSSIDPTNTNNVQLLFGTNPYGNKGAYNYTYFENEATAQTVKALAGGRVIKLDLPTQDFSYDMTYASTPWIQSQLIGGTRENLFRFHTLADGTNANTELKVSLFNIKPGKTTDDYATFSIMVRGYSDTDRKKEIKETYSGLNLNPSSPNYIAKIIGDMHVEIDNTGKQTSTGDYENFSKKVRVEVATGYPMNAVPFAHEAYMNTVTVTDPTMLPAVIFSTGSKDNSASAVTNYSGIDLNTTSIRIDNSNYNKPLPVVTSVGANTAFSFDAPINTAAGLVNLGFAPTGSENVDINKRQFTVSFQGGFDGVSPSQKISLGADMEINGDSQGFDLSTSTSIGTEAYFQAINSIQSPDDYDINLVAVPGVVRRLHASVFDKVVDMVESREDAFFIGDLSAVNDSIDQVTTQAEAVDSNYVGSYYPWMKIADANTNKLVSVPPSVLMPGIYASNDAIAAEWFAPAGLNRGGIVGAVAVLNRLTHAERDELYEGKVNPIAVFPSEGIVAFGQKTLQDAASALDRINVRRLLIKVKKYIASTSKYLVFEQNTGATRNKFLNTVNPYLEGIQQRQGLYTFKVVMDETNNTPDLIDRNMMVGQIYLQPTKTAEFIVLDFNIMPTGATFSA